MDRLLRLMSSDKALHFLWCFLITCLVGSVFSPLWGVVTSAVVSLCKEWYDKRLYNGWCWYDLLADFCGVVCACMILMV